ncbi:MAG: acyl-CoA dehydrogenase family protein [Actinobacteria bacterium]|nr:acyl-CoA dehydrogenase family protein [Actinomycetota bacterium]
MTANLVEDLTGVDAFSKDAIADAVITEHAPWSRPHAEKLGRAVWDPATLAAARDAHRYPPELRTHDRLGRRIDVVEFHPAYHQLMAAAFGHGVHALAWTATEPGGHLARAVQSYLWNQVDGGTACPTGMAYAAVPTLRDTPELAAYAERVARHDYDPVYAPVETKRAATVGYAMTEKQGGSDLRANVTVAQPAGPRGPGQAYRLNGHKWFCSAPMSDGFFTVAQTAAGPTCFFVPRWRPDGTANGIVIQRLKDKLGNRANASSEIEYDDACGLAVGEEGRGVRTILTSSDYTRLDFAVGSAGLMRAALSQALHYADHRTAFGQRLADLPVQAAVLADLALEWAGATRLAFRLARTMDDRDDESERLLGRILTPVAKYWNCKRAPLVAEEAIECIGGNGYIEEHPLPRYYREAPLNAIWEGTSNMMVLDVQRVLAREPKAIEPLLDEIRAAAPAEPRLAAAAAAIEAAATRPDSAGPDGASRDRTGRRLVSQIALAVQASLLVRQAPGAVADAFCASRLDGDWAPTFGTLPAAADAGAIIDYARLAS